MIEMTQIPDGYMQNAQGHLVPKELVTPLDMARHELVAELVGAAREVSETIAKFKAGAMADIGAFIEMSADQYGAKLGGNKGNVTLMTFDGRFKVQRAIAETIIFDERLQVAKSLIDSCIRRWAQGSAAEIRALVEHAFQVDKEGKVSTSRVLGLRRLDITDAEWIEAMKAISDSTSVAGSKSYIRIYERVGDGDTWRAIPLDAAAV